MPSWSITPRCPPDLDIDRKELWSSPTDPESGINPGHTMPLTSSKRLLLLVSAGIALCGGVLLVRPGWVHRQAFESALRSESIDESDLSETALRSLTSSESQRLWGTGRMGHRRALLSDWIARRDTPERSAPIWTARGDSWLREAASDPDLELRTRALGALRSMDSAVASQSIRVQLADADPEVRRLGLETLRRIGSVREVDWVLPRLEDSDPSLVLLADSLLRTWTGRDSGLRLSRILPGGTGLVSKEISEEDRHALKTAATEWRALFPGRGDSNAWDATQRAMRPAVSLRADDFELEDLRGNRVKLSQFKGRRVLLNFWATWCPACLVELPVLAELQRRHTNDLTVIGISLDSPAGTEAADHALSRGETKALQSAVGSVAARHRVPYPILLDPERRIGRRFNGGELPTQVLIDRDGQVRRRFVGGRSMEAWEALLTDTDR